MLKALFTGAVAVLALSCGSVYAAAAADADTLDTATLTTIESQFSRVMELANRHDTKALHEMFWQSPSALLVAKSAIPSEGNWAGYWGNDAIDQKLRDIAAAGPAILQPDLSKFKVVSLGRRLITSLSRYV